MKFFLNLLASRRDWFLSRQHKSMKLAQNFQKSTSNLAAIAGEDGLIEEADYLEHWSEEAVMVCISSSLKS